MTDKKYYYGTGRRKTAVARVRLYEGGGKAVINDKDVELANFILEPLTIAGKTSSFQISARIRGGGWSAQQQALRLGIARALVNFDSSLRATLKKSGLLSRDDREVERKKPGLKKARRAPQWSKR